MSVRFKDVKRNKSMDEIILACAIGEYCDLNDSEILPDVDTFVNHTYDNIMNGCKCFFVDSIGMDGDWDGYYTVFPENVEDTISMDRAKSIIRNVYLD